MLFKLFNGNHLSNLVLLPLVGIALLLSTFFDPSIVVEPITKLTSPVCHLQNAMNLGARASTILNFGLVMLIVFILLKTNAEFDIVDNRNFLPGYLFMFIVYAFPRLHLCHPIYFAAIFFVLTLRSLIASVSKKRITTDLFNAGFFLSVGSIFYLPLVLFFILIPIAAILVRKQLLFRELIASFIGYILPWLLVFAIYFIFFDLNELYSMWQNSFEATNAIYLDNKYYLIYLGIIVVLTIISSAYMLFQYDREKVNTRNYNKILFIYFVGLMFSIALPQVTYEVIVMAAIPLVFLIANYLTNMKSRFWQELFFAVIIAVTVIMQFVLK